MEILGKFQEKKRNKMVNNISRVEDLCGGSIQSIYAENLWGGSMVRIYAEDLCRGFLLFLLFFSPNP